MEITTLEKSKPQNNTATYLRRTGAALLVGAGAAYMMQGWQDFNSTARYLHFFLFSLLLMLAGLASAKMFHDEKGARTFLGIATATVMVHFSQLGALIYSFFPGIESHLPHGLIFSGGNPSSVSVLLGLNLLVAIPMARMGFRVLARTQATLLSQAYLLGSTLLLLPFRTEAASVALITGLGIILAIIERKRFDGDLQMRTLEGWIARAILWTPVFTLMGRGCFYSQTGFLSGLILAFLSYATLRVVPKLTENKEFRGLASAAAFLSGVVSWNFLATAVDWNLLAGPYDFIATWLPAPIFVAIISLLAGKANSIGVRKASAVYALLLAGIVCLGYAGGVLSLALYLLASFHIALGTQLEEKTPTQMGFYILGLAVLHSCRTLFFTLNFGIWVSLAIAGVLIVLIASMIENKTHPWILKARSLGSKWGEWK
jgi:hypothetical protein